MARVIPAAINKEQGFFPNGQGHDEEMTSPLPIVVDLDSFLALTGHFNHGAVRVNPGRLEKLIWLFWLNLLSRLIEYVHQSTGRFTVKPTAETASRCGVGNAQHTEISFVVASKLQTLPASTAGQLIAGGVESRIGLRIRQFVLQPRNMLVDGLVQSKSPCENLYPADLTGCDGLCFLSKFIENLRGRNHRTYVSESRLVQPSLYSSIVWRQWRSYLGLYLKTLGEKLMVVNQCNQ